MMRQRRGTRDEGEASKARAWRLALAMLAGLFVAAPAAQAIGHSDAGTTGAQFLKVGVSPRLAGLGEAYGALGDDAGSIFSNPAGLGYVDRKEAEFVHAALVADVQLNSIFYAHPLRDPLGNLALNYTIVDFGKITRTILNAPGAANPFSTSGTFTAQDQALSVAYADKFTLWDRMFRWGMTVKLLQQTIGAEQATGLAYDAGIIYAPVARNWRVGATVQNLGFLSKFRDEADPLPLNFKLSGAAFFMGEKLRLGLDVNFPLDNTPILNTGVEFYPIPQVALRGGYRFDDNTTDFRGPTAGIGVTLAGITLDYAYVPFELLGTNHKFSLTARFGETVSKATTRREHLVERPQPPVRAQTVPPPSYAPPGGPSTTVAPGVRVAVTYAASNAPTYAPSSSAVAANTPIPGVTSPYVAPIPAAAEGARVMGVRPAIFIYHGTDPKYAWIGPATREVFIKDWTKRGTYSPRGMFSIEGDYEIVGGQLKLGARLWLKGAVVGSFESAGDASLPFTAWSDLLNAMNGRLASLGVR